MEVRRLTNACELPGRHVLEILVIAKGLTVLRLVLLAEMATRRLATLESVVHEELVELEVRVLALAVVAVAA